MSAPIDSLGATASLGAPPGWRASPVWHGFVRAAGSAWFLLLGLMVLRVAFGTSHGAGAGVGAGGWADLLAKLCIASFYLALWVLILIRPAPRAQAIGVLPTLMAFLGTYLPWALPLLPAGHPPASVQLLSAAMLLGGGSLVLFTVLHLGRSFSLVPQARGLVRSGPYRLIRHPLYLAEEISVLGAALHFWSLWAVALVLVHFAIQVRRMIFEEELLSSIFSEYPAYAAATPRLFPKFWKS